MSLLCLLLVFIHIFETSGLNFISPYNGQTITGVVGSSVHFKWNFTTAGLRRIEWGLKKNGQNTFETNGILVTIDTLGNVLLTSRSEYATRVNGTIDVSSGQATFILANLKRADERFYGARIIPISGEDLPVFDSVQMVIKEAPKITLPAVASATYDDESAVSISCEATGSPVPDVRWIHNGQVKSSGSRTAQLTFSKISKADAGIYTCRANNSVGTKEKQLNLVVYYKPEGTTITTSAAQNSPIQGETVTLTCNVAAANPLLLEYRFYLNDSNKAINSNTNVNQYTIHDVQRSRDYGAYKCVANNSAGNGQSDKVVLNIRVPARIQFPIANVTVNEQDPIDLICVASGHPVPSVTWTKDGRPVQSARGGVIHINSSTRKDAGVYVCKADNLVGQADQEKSYVTVNYTATIEMVSSSVSKSWIGQTVKLTCVSDGVPTPILSWYNPEGTKFNSLQANENTVEVTMYSDKDFGLYNCTANNGFVSASKKLRLFQIKAPGSPFITSTAADIQATSLTIRWSPPAEDGGSPITAYQVSILNERNVTDPKVTSLEIGELQKNTHYTVMVSARNYVFKGNASHKKMKTKFEDAPEPVVITADAKDDKVTLKWKEPENNGAVIMRYTIYKRIGNDEHWTMVDVINDISKREFNVRVEKSKQYEFVVTATNKYGESLKNKHRVKIVVVFGGTSKPLENQTGSCADLHAAYNSVIILLLIIIIILSVALWRMRRPCTICRQNAIPMNPIPMQEKDSAEPSSEDCEEEANEPTSDATAVVGDYMPLHPSGRSWEISREQVNVIKVIGKGAFSQVAQATVRDMRGRQEKTVAVKMLKENAPDSDRKDLLSELELMKKMKPHPHVINLIGCVTKNDPLLVLIEYVPFGDLLGYLRKSRGLNDTYYKDPDVKPKTNLTAEQLMKFAWQVADGMCYLSSKKIIHRDLAARNVLVGEGEKCKVTDFGMARNVQQDDIYTRKSRGRLPVKWTAYEALLYGVYTTQSDVWSYGILLYEILTIGGSPYPNINARDIAGKIQEGYRMPKPRHVDSKLFEIMLKCWKENPNDRSTFDDLRKTMKDFWKKHKTYVNLNEYDNRMYVNLNDLTAE